MWIALLGSGAFAYEIADFECCHLDEVPQAAASLQVTVVPPADRRGPLTNHPEDWDKWAKLAGIVRGGYGNPWNLWSPRDMRDLITDAVVAQLKGAGHTVSLASKAAPRPGLRALDDAELIAAVPGGGLILHGTVDTWEVDIGAYGTRKVAAEVDLFVVDATTKARTWSTTLHLNDHAEGVRVLGENEYTARADAWYGKVGFKYLETAVVESALVALVEPLTARGPAAFGAPTTPPATGGCGKDTDCKGDRVCEAGACVAPN